MLVITRREGEEVVIGDPSNPIGVVRIASIKGDRVRVAFDFPRHIDVHRREVAEQILAALAGAGAALAPTTPTSGRDAHAEDRRPVAPLASVTVQAPLAH